MTTIVTKNGSGAPLASDLVQGELAVDLTNKRLYTEDSGGTVIEVGTSPSTIDINAGTIDGTVIGGASAAAGTFTTFTSTGIDDNATSTAITIDASENVLVGTNIAYGNDGTTIGAGEIVSKKTSFRSLTLERISTDGEIAAFRKDGTTVGSVACRSSGGNLQIYTNQSGIDFGGDGYLPMRGSTITDNSLDIGGSSFRFKDLYLSGGAYLGGTAAANHLDDYEEGTWTPTHGGNNMTGTARYRKIGSAVTLYFDITSASGSTSSTRIGGLPFAVSTLHGAWHVGYQIAVGTHIGGYVDTVSAELISIAEGSVSGVNLNAGERLIGVAHYIAP